MLSPVEPILPGAPAELPGVYASIPKEIDVVLDIPGPLAMPPGTINRSRPRARWFLYALGQSGKRRLEQTLRTPLQPPRDNGSWRNILPT